ncbi:hypothetical protein JCM3770_000738 [Rhodotorula araucariae]
MHAGYTLTATQPAPATRTYTARTAPPSRLALVSESVVAVVLIVARLRLAALLAIPLVLWCSLETTETLTLVPSLGIQLSRTRRTPLAPLLTVSRSIRFLPLDCIANVVLNDALDAAQARAYLAIVDRDGNVHVVFPSILPRPDDLEPVYNHARALLVACRKSPVT